MLSGVLGRTRGSGDKNSERDRGHAGHANISHPRPSFTMDASPLSSPSVAGFNTQAPAQGAVSSSSSSLVHPPGPWPISPTLNVAGGSSVGCQDSLNSFGSSAASGKARQPSGPPASHVANVVTPGGERLASHSLLPEEMRAMQRERERERDAALNSETSRQNINVSGSNSGRAASSSKSPYSSNHMESSVTRLLVATKMLLEALTKWSTGQKTETQVSDVYVRLGNDFITARKAFASYNIEMTDLASVPDDLRICLERCLSEDASPAVLEQHLPRVREIIIRLLQGLKLKQAEYKRILVASQRGSTGSAKRQSNSGDRPQRNSRLMRLERHGVSDGLSNLQLGSKQLESNPDARSGASQRSASSAAEPSIASTVSRPSPNPSGIMLQDDGVQPAPSGPRSSDVVASSSPRKANQTIPARREESTSKEDPEMQRALSMNPRSSSVGRPPVSLSVGKLSRSHSNVDVVPLQGDANDADPSLRALKSRDALERRASKRFSAYTFNKMGVGQGFGQSFGSGNLGMSMLSMGAVSGSLVAERSLGHKRTGSRRQKPSISEMPIEEQPPLPESSPYLTKKSPRFGQASDVEGLTESSAPLRKTPSKTTSVASGLLPPQPQGPPSPTPSQQAANSTESLPFVEAKQSSVSLVKLATAEQTQVSRSLKPESDLALSGTLEMDRNIPSAIFVAEDASQEVVSRQSEVSVFLQLGGQTRKASLDRTTDIGIARLRMLFIDRFAYSPGKEDFPPIYIKDVASGVSYELEDLNDITNNCLLTLNIEPLDQVKQHLDLSLGAITRELREVKAALADRDRGLLAAATAASRRPSLASPNINDHSFSIPLPSSSKFSAQDFAAAGQRVASARLRSDGTVDGSIDGSGKVILEDGMRNEDPGSGARMANELRAHYEEVQALRTEMAILRQLQCDFSTDVGGLLKKMKEQTVKVRAIAATEVPAERNFIIAGKSRLDSSSQEVLTLVEDLQDVVDDLKLDVIQRGVKPKPATLKKISGDIEKATRGLEDVESYVQTVKPSWKKTWESELQNIVDEQEFLNHQEGLLADLRDDHTALQEVYENIQQVVKLRSASRPAGGKYIPPLPEEGHEGLSTVMLEVRGQNIDHERRLRALQAAEKSRQREISMRTDEFTEELAGFVSGKAGEGLRKTGGHLEAERVRSKRDKATLLAMFGAGGSGGAPYPAVGDAIKPRKLKLGSGGDRKTAKPSGDRGGDESVMPTLAATMGRNPSVATAVSSTSQSTSASDQSLTTTASLGAAAPSDNGPKPEEISRS